MSPGQGASRRRGRRSLRLDPQAIETRADQASTLLRAMASPHRLVVLCNLAAGECSVGELGRHVPLSQSALSQHLAVLREEGLVETRREAQTIYYSLASGPAREVISVLYRCYCGTSGSRSRRSAA